MPRHFNGYGVHGRCLAAAMTLSVLMAACGGGEKTTPAPASTGPVTAVDPAGGATVTGKITFEGTAPAPEPIKTTSDPNCAQAGSPATTESLLVGGGGGLQNVFVYVKDGLGNALPPLAVWGVTRGLATANRAPPKFPLRSCPSRC